MEADAVDGAERCSDLIEADQDLDLGLEADTRGQGTEPMRETVSTSAHLAASHRDAQEERRPGCSDDGSGKDAKPHARGRAADAAPFSSVKVLPLTHAPLAERTRVARVAALAMCSIAGGCRVELAAAGPLDFARGAAAVVRGDALVDVCREA